jgi:hypothetical protein
MKTKNLLLNTIACVFFSSNLFAADLCVNEAGSGGCYSTITAALTAANDGDRILIQPKTGNAPYVENLTINKSVQLLSNQEGVMWSLAGNITVTPAVGRTIAIMHMQNTGGNITASGHSPIGTRCKVNIMNCELMNGNINFDYNYFDVNVISNVLSDGYVALRYGNVIGNNITASTYTNMYYPTPYNHRILLYYSTDASATNDTLYIVGNILKIESTVSTYYNNITINSNAQYFYISNNYLTKLSTYSDCYGIRFYIHKTSTVGTNCIYNNTINNPNQNGSTFYPIQIVSNTSGVFDIKNNISYTPNLGGGYNVYSFTATPTVGFSYNFGAPGTLSGIVNNGTNNLNSNSSINYTTGQLNAGSDGINGGYPDLTFYDLDLTVNDVGAYGGSFSLTNFHPITGAARVYFVKAPRTVLQSGTLNIKAESFDR